MAMRRIFLAEHMSTAFPCLQNRKESAEASSLPHPVLSVHLLRCCSLSRGVFMIIAMPTQLFYTTQIPVSLWFLNKQKKQPGKALFIDARKLGTMVSRKLRELTEEDIQKIADTYKRFVDGSLEDEKGYCAVVSTEDIRVGKAGEASGIQGAEALVHISGEASGVPAGVPAKVIADLISQEVLSQEKIFDGVVLQEGAEGGKEGRVILDLKAQMDLDIGLVLPSEGDDGIHIVLQLEKAHF